MISAHNSLFEAKNSLQNNLYNYSVNMSAYLQTAGKLDDDTIVASPEHLIHDPSIAANFITANALLQQTWQTLMAHRMKGMLAIVAIAWGVISVVVLIALGERFYRHHQTQQLSFMVNNVQSRLSVEHQQTLAWKHPETRIGSQDKVDMIEQSGFVKQASSVYAKWDANVTNEKGQNLTSFVSGIDSQYFSLIQRKLGVGFAEPFTQWYCQPYPRCDFGGSSRRMGGIRWANHQRVNGIPFW